MKSAHKQLLALVLLAFGSLSLPAQKLNIYPAIELEFSTAPGHYYQFQYSSNLVAWFPFGEPVAGTGSEYSMLLSAKNTQKRFYRLAPVDVAAGLVASFRFDGNATDSSTNGNHGVAYNLTLTTNRFGQPNAAYRFAGTSDSYVRVPSSASLNITNEITLAAWINFEVGGTIYPRILNKHSYELATGEYFRTTRRLYFTIETPPQTQLATSTEVLQAGRWHFVAATYDGALLLLYVDGELLAATVAPGGMQPSDLDLNIGRNAANSADNFKGLIDNVRIYNRALTESELLQLFNQAD